jgi:hypothetical protein
MMKHHRLVVSMAVFGPHVVTHGFTSVLPGRGVYRCVAQFVLLLYPPTSTARLARQIVHVMWDPKTGSLCRLCCLFWQQINRLTFMFYILLLVSHPPTRHASDKLLTPMTRIGNARSSDFYGASRDSDIVKEFSIYEELEEIVQLAAQPIPERPDGIVCVAKYSSIQRDDCQATEAEYERLARKNPATIFLRCMEEYENANLLLSQANIQALPTFDVFYQGNRVARVSGSDMVELERVLQMYQFQNSELDLFSENAERTRLVKWGDETTKDMNRTPRTTARFVPGYDWNSNKGFFDKQASKVEKDFADTYGNWVPIIDDDDDVNDDDDDKKKKK